MRVIDASSMIWAWDNYPIGQIPNLWAWLEEEVGTGELIIPAPAFAEVNHKVPACGTWLEENGCNVVQVSNDIAQSAVQIQALLGIANDNYHPKGVDGNDVFVISTARTLELPLLSDENRQQTLPPDRRRYKIPAVCGIAEVNVDCRKFVEFFKASGRIV